LSTYWYFRCDSHTPPVESDEEFTQHTNDSAFRHGLELLKQRPVSYDDMVSQKGEGDVASDYFAGNAVRFLQHHPHCKITVINEYGVEWPLEDEQSSPDLPADPYQWEKLQ
jgi:hypothetical protein